MERNEYQALRHGAGTIELQRGKIAVTGEDRVRWLHSMVTNDVKSLAPGSGCYCFVLDAQGHIQADCNVYMEAERLIVDCEAFVTAKLMALFDRFIIMDQVELADLSSSMPTLAVEGPRAMEVVSAIKSGIDKSGLIVYPTAHGVHLWGPLREIPGAVPVSREAYETVRIENGVPRYGVDIDDTTIPNETGQLNAIHFNKGCYIGQEIVERVRSRGHVNRIFTGFRATQDGPIPAPVTFEGVRITSATYSPGLACWIALGYIRREHDVAGTKVTIKAGVPLEVCPVPFVVPD